MLPNEKKIYNKNEMKAILKYERKIYNIKFWEQLITYGERGVLFKHQRLLRKTEYHVNSNHKIRASIFKYRLRKYQNKYLLHIPINCCERGLHIMHVGPVLMNAGVCVGKDCTFHMNSALVAGGVNDLSPSLGDNVILGIGAVVVGNVKIANKVAIGANAVVNKSIEVENVGVAGVPARIISNKGYEAWKNRD